MKRLSDRLKGTTAKVPETSTERSRAPRERPRQSLARVAKLVSPEQPEFRFVESGEDHSLVAAVSSGKEDLGMIRGPEYTAMWERATQQF